MTCHHEICLWTFSAAPQDNKQIEQAREGNYIKSLRGKIRKGNGKIEDKKGKEEVEGNRCKR